MRFKHHRLAAATVTIAALGAGAAPALAASAAPTHTASQTKLVQVIKKFTPRIRQNVDVGEVPKLLANATACGQALGSVARTPATAAQRSAMREWLSGVHSQMISDQQIAAGDLERLSGQKRAGKRELSLGLRAAGRADTEVARADTALGVK